MVCKILFLITEILSSHYSRMETFNLSNFKRTFKQVRSLQEYALDYVSRNVKLSFKNNETREINYSKLKGFYYFRDESIVKNIINGHACYALSTFSLSAFIIFMKTFDMLNDLDVLIEFVNYNDLDEIIDLALLLQPNPLSKQIVKDFINYERGILQLKSQLDDEKIDEKTLEIGITRSLSKIEYFNFIEFVLHNQRGIINILTRKLNNILNDDGLQILQNFILFFSRIEGFSFVLNDSFWLHVNIFENNSRDKKKYKCSEYIHIVFISKRKTRHIDFKTYKIQIDFVIDIYKRGLGKDHNVFCCMDEYYEYYNSNKLLTFFKKNYKMKIISGLSDMFDYEIPEMKRHFFLFNCTPFLAIEFLEPTLLETINIKCRVIKIDENRIHEKQPL